MTNPTNVIGTDRMDTGSVGLRAHFERLLLEQDRLRQTELAGLRAEMIARLDASDRALIIQLEASEKALLLKSTENDRRLDALNGEAGRLATVLSRSVPREVWEQSQNGLSEWKAAVDKQLNQMAGSSKQTVFIIGLIIVAVQIAIRFFVR